MTAGSVSWSRNRRTLRRAVSRHRRMLAALLLAAAVLAGLGAVAPQRPELSAVIVAAHDLGAGQVLGSGDLAVVGVPLDLRPDGALADPATLAGRSVAAPVRKGEPITDVRLVGPGLLTGSAGLVAAPVRLADAAAVALVRPGDLVDVLAAAGTDPTGQAYASSVAQLVATRARVLALPRSSDASPADGALVLLAVSPETALALAGAAATARLSLVVRPSHDRPGVVR